MKFFQFCFISAAYGTCPQSRPFAQTSYTVVPFDEAGTLLHFCCPAFETPTDECASCVPTDSSNCDNYLAPDNEIGNSHSVPSWVYQCPRTYPFARYGEGTNTVQECCKCQYQTKCQASSGANSPNIGAVAAMMADDGEIDQSGLMCDLECSETEECRYERENCEYKCYNSAEIKIWASVGDVAGLVIIGSIVFFVVRHLSKSQVKNTMNVEKQLKYEVPYQYTVDRNVTQNEAVDIENEDNYEDTYNSAEYETYGEMYEPYADNKNGT